VGYYVLSDPVDNAQLQCTHTLELVSTLISRYNSSKLLQSNGQISSSNERNHEIVGEAAYRVRHWGRTSYCNRTIGRRKKGRRLRQKSAAQKVVRLVGASLPVMIAVINQRE